jgi:hypothetical protein
MGGTGRCAFEFLRGGTRTVDEAESAKRLHAGGQTLFVERAALKTLFMRIEKPQGLRRIPAIERRASIFQKTHFFRQ